MSTKQMTILFQGDSITDGTRTRNPEQNYQHGQSYVNMIAGRLGYDLANHAPRFYNRGTSGHRVSDLYARWNEDAFSLKPDLISILIGVNDAWRIMNGEPTGATDRFERAYRHLLEETREVLPHTGLVLCEPFILKSGAVANNWDAWLKKMAEYQSIVRQLAEEFDAVFVPLQEPFNKACQRAEAEYWIYDGVHPTAAGHFLIAHEWLSVVERSRLAIR